MNQKNATFLTFTQSSKWAYSGRGYASKELFNLFNKNEQRHQILDDNGGSCPGMNGNGIGYIIVVIPDEDCPHGWPLHINI